MLKTDRETCKVLSIQVFVVLCFLTLSLSFGHADVTLTIGDGSGPPGSTDDPVDVSLANPDDKVKGVQVDICDEGDYLTCTGCEAEDTRTASFSCKTYELANGCCRVILVSDLGLMIDEGAGSILTVRYDVSENAPAACTDLNPENVKVSDEIEDPLAVNVFSGKLCFFVCGDIYPDESSPGSNDCGDGVTDIFDVIEAIDIVLGIGDHSDCQLIRADLPNGMPPNCREPNGEIDIFDVLVIIDIVLDREDCCNYYYYGSTKCTTDADCDDGLYCNGEETCNDGVCQSGSNPCPDGTTCNEQTDSCDDSSTTSTSTTTIIPPPPPPPSCDVSISPSSAGIDSGGTLQFTALTMCDGQEVKGEYLWEIEPESTIGSTVDEDGLFAAGGNTTDFEIEETVKVTDTAHDNKSDTAIVTINVKEKPIPECEVTVSPSSATVSSGETLSLVAETTGEGCLAGDYEWSIDTEIESVVDPDGNYTAGINTTGGQATDVITVVDRANSDISTAVMITVESNVVSVLPAKLMGSRWVPLFYFLFITSEDADFDRGSTISFEPAGGDILPLGQIVLGKVMIAMVILSANPQEGTVDVIVDTGGEIATGKITIQLLPFIFADDCLGNPESCNETPL